MAGWGRPLEAFAGARSLAIRTLAPAGMPKAAGAAIRRCKVFHHREGHLRYRHDDELCNTLAGLDGESRLAAVPATDHQLALIVGIYQSHEIAQHDAVLMPQA